MEGSASVRRSLCGTLVAPSLATVALRQPLEESGAYSRKVLEEEEYIEVGGCVSVCVCVCVCVGGLMEPVTSCSRTL